jgi:cohesin loading factor subunit SCC2
MLHPAVKKSVSQRFGDDAKSVREAAVALVGTFVVHTPEVANAFHTSLSRCLTDDGVSVKKRAIRIFRDVLLSNPLYKGRAAACAVMLRLAADPKEDDSVRDLIHAFFTELWLEGDASASARASSGARKGELAPSSANQARASSGSRNEVAFDPPLSVAGIVTPLTPRGSNAIAANRASQHKADKNDSSSGSPEQCRGFFAMEQMVEVVMAADSTDILTALLKDLMFGFTDADKDCKASERRKKNDALHSHCSSLVDALMEQLLILEENRSVHGESFGKKLVAIVRTISVFGEVAPAEVLRHVDTITPYLKADNSVSREQESQIVSEICDLIFRLSSVMTENDIMRLGEGGLVEDLVSITYRFGSGPLTGSMRTLAGLANHAEGGSESVIGRELMKLVTTFYGYLMKVKRADRDFSTCDVSIEAYMAPALYCIIRLLLILHPPVAHS